MPPKVLRKEAVNVDPKSMLVRLDGIIVCKIVRHDGVAFLQFIDRDSYRSNCRKTMYVEIALCDFTSEVERYCTS